MSTPALDPDLDLLDPDGPLPTLPRQPWPGWATLQQVRDQLAPEVLGRLDAAELSAMLHGFRECIGQLRRESERRHPQKAYGDGR